MTSALILLPFLSVAQQESGTRKAICWSVTVYCKQLSSQSNLTAQIEPVQDKKKRNYLLKRWNILCLTLKNWEFFIWTQITQLQYASVENLLTCRKHLHNRIISLRGEVWAHKASLKPPLYIGLPVPCQEGERLCICVLMDLFLRLSMWI